MFKKACSISDIPVGEMQAFELEGKTILISNIKGQYFVVDDTCTHEQCSLSEGDLDEQTITCPCHGAQFDATDGRVTALPAVKDLQRYAVKVEGEDVLVELDV